MITFTRLSDRAGEEFFTTSLMCSRVFASVESASLLAMMVVGGIGSIPGAILGGIALTILPEAMRFIGEFRLVLYGAAVVAIIIFAPKGLGGLVDWVDGVLSGTIRLGKKRKAETADEEAQV